MKFGTKFDKVYIETFKMEENKMKDNFTNNLEETFDNFYTKGALLTVGDEKKANTMTISWGTVGFMWRKPMFVIMVRASRYSNEFLEVGKTYTVSVPFDGAMKEALKICGTKSGRDTDKEKEAGLKYIPSKEIKTPIVEGCSKYYECKVVFKQEMNLDNMPEDMKNSFYGEGETKHIFYYGEILAQY